MPVASAATWASRDAALQILLGLLNVWGDRWLRHESAESLEGLKPGGNLQLPAVTSENLTLVYNT